MLQLNSLPSRRGPGSYRHNQLETVSRALAMQMAARDDSAAADGADLRLDANGFVIPDPTTEFEALSENSEKDSPSQYRPGSKKSEGSDGTFFWNVFNT